MSTYEKPDLKRCKHCSTIIEEPTARDLAADGTEGGPYKRYDCPECDWWTLAGTRVSRA